MCYCWLMTLTMFVTVSLEKWYCRPVTEVSDRGSTTVTIFDKWTRQISSGPMVGTTWKVRVHQLNFYITVLSVGITNHSYPTTLIIHTKSIIGGCNLCCFMISKKVQILNQTHFHLILAYITAHNIFIDWLIHFLW